MSQPSRTGWIDLLRERLRERKDCVLSPGACGDLAKLLAKSDKQVIGPTPQERTNALLRECAMRIDASNCGSIEASGPQWSIGRAESIVQLMRERGWLEWEPKPVSQHPIEVLKSLVPDLDPGLEARLRAVADEEIPDPDFEVKP